MNIERLPSQLHLSFNSSVDIEVLLSTAVKLFPDAENIEARGATLYLYKPHDSIEFIHISQHKIGVVFSSELMGSKDVEYTWELVETLITKMKVSNLKDFELQIRSVHPFKTKKERDVIAKRLSPVAGYSTNLLTLYPEGKQEYYIQLNMVTKNNKQYGLKVSFVYEIDNIKRKDVSSKLMAISDRFAKSNEINSLSEGIFGA